MDFVQFCKFKARDHDWDVARCTKEWAALAAKKTKDNHDNLGTEGPGLELRLDVVVAEVREAGVSNEESKELRAVPSLFPFRFSGGTAVQIQKIRGRQFIG